jgi:hypothetical protein
VSLATDHKQYPAALSRLEASLRAAGFDGQLICWRGGNLPVGAPDHATVPFAFKPCGLAEARRRGCRILLWLDASCVVVRPIRPLLERIARTGYLLFANQDLRLGAWASDVALDAFGLDRDRAMDIPEINAAVIGIDAGDRVGGEFLDRWLAAAEAGVAFRGVVEPLRGSDDYRDVKWNRGGRVSADPRVRGHRHDQTVAGILAHQLGMELATAGVQPYTRRRLIHRETRIIIDRDVGKPGVPLAQLHRIRLATGLGALVPGFMTRARAAALRRRANAGRRPR